MSTEYHPKPWPALLKALADRIRQGTLDKHDESLVRDAAAAIERLNITLHNRRSRMNELDDLLEEANSPGTDQV
jgi:hypothetical protein